MLAVVLKASSAGVYADTTALLNYGFNEFKPVELTAAGMQEGVAAVQKGVEKSVNALTSRQLSYNLPVGDNQGAEKEIALDKSLTAPVKKGQKIGTVKFLRQGEVLGTVDLVSDRDVDKKPSFRWWYGPMVLGPLLLLILLQSIFRRRRYRMRKKRWN